MARLSEYDGTINLSNGSKSYRLSGGLIKKIANVDGDRSVFQQIFEYEENYFNIFWDRLACISIASDTDADVVLAVDDESFIAILQYVQGLDVSFNINNISKLIRTVSTYGLKGLRDKLIATYVPQTESFKNNFMALTKHVCNPDTASDILNLFISQNVPDIINDTVQFSRVSELVVSLLYSTEVYEH